MFWRMTGLSTASPVETILDKGKFSLEELLDEDEIIQECKALNGRLINFLRERPQVEQLINFIVEEAPEDAEHRRTFKFPFVSCEIFTCEVDIILKTLVEDDELMKKLFSFLEPEHSHSASLAGYFSKVVICLLMRKTVSLMNYIQAHKEIIRQLVDLIGITSIMEVLIRLIGADEHIYANYTEAMRWLEDTDVLEMIVDKFSSSDSAEVHANVAETLCAITRYAPPGIAAKISSPSLIGRLFQNALEESRPKSVLVNSLPVCISLLDPKRSTFGSYYSYSRQFTQGPSVTANAETVEGMLGNLGNLLSLLDVSAESFLLTSYGKLQPPLGKQRLKIIEFISVLLSTGNEDAESEVIRLKAVQRILDLFFEYPYNNFLHHHVEVIVLYCLENKKSTLVDHLLRDCNLVGRILEAERSSLLTTDPSKPTCSIDGTYCARIGNIGHLTRISNKLVHLANTSTEIQGLLQENAEWLDWCANVLSKRNAVENVHQWVCGRPNHLHDRGRDSDGDDYQDRDYDISALAYSNNSSQDFHYGIHSNDIDEVQSPERDEEDVFVDDKSAEVVISSLRLGDDQESGSVFTNPDWFASGEDRANEEPSADSLDSPSPGDEHSSSSTVNDEVAADDDLVDTAASSQDPETETETKTSQVTERGGEQTEWVEWRETSNSDDKQEAASNEVEESIVNNESEPLAREVGQPESIVDIAGAESVGESLSSTSMDTSSNEVTEPVQVEHSAKEKTDLAPMEN